MLDTIHEFLEWEKSTRDTIDVKKIYIDVCGDLVTGILLSQIVYWYLPNEKREHKLTINIDGKLWIAKSRNDWWAECRISPKQFDRVIAILEKKGFVETKVLKFHGSPTKHICLSLDTLFDAIKKILGRGENRFLPKGNIEIDQREISIFTKGEEPNNVTKTTTEITTEKHKNTHTHNNAGTDSETNSNGSKRDCVCASSLASPSTESIVVVDRLKAWFSQEFIDNLLLKYPVSYLNEKVNLTLTAKPKNPAGFFSKALQENWKGNIDPSLQPEPEWVKEQKREYAELLKQEYLDRPDIGDWEKQWALDWEKKYGYFPDPEIERILKVGRYAPKTGKRT